MMVMMSLMRMTMMMMMMTEKSCLHQTPSPCFFPVALIEAVFRGKVWICERQDLTEVPQEIVFRGKRCRFTRFLLVVITEQPQVVLSVNMEPRESINWVNTTQLRMRTDLGPFSQKWEFFPLGRFFENYYDGEVLS